MLYTLQKLKALAASEDFDVLKVVGHQGPIIWDQINQELAALKANTIPPADKIQELLLVSIAAHQSYAVQELSTIMGKDNSDGKYNGVLKKGLDLAVLTNNANGCVERICFCAKPEALLLADAMHFAQDKGFVPSTPNAYGYAFGGIDILARFLKGGAPAKKTEPVTLKGIRLDFNIAKNGEGIGPDFHVHDAVSLLGKQFERSSTVSAKVFYDPQGKLPEDAVIDVLIKKDDSEGILAATLRGEAPLFDLRVASNGKYEASLSRGP